MTVRPRPVPTLAPPLALWLLTFAPIAVLGQDDIETESITEQGTLDPFAVDDAELRPIFEEAERLFRSFDQPDSVPLFDRLIARLESARASGPLEPELRDMLIRSRAHRAEAYFNVGENERAAEDLRRILQIEPGWQIDPDMVSPKLVEVVEELRRGMVGEILVLVDPIDASVTLGGEPIEIVGQTAAVLAGSQTLSVSRPGYSSVEEVVEIKPGETITVDHTLERLSAVARLRIDPAGAEVLVDGQPGAVAAREPVGADAEELAVEDLGAGAHVIELRLADYRPLRLTLDIGELDDYRLPPASLERMEGEVRLAELPAGATVLVDDRPVTLEDESAPALALAPGDYVVEVRQAGVGGFRQQVSVGDQEVVQLTVRLRPTIAFLGVLGSDRLAASDLGERLAGRFGELAQWLWRDHSIEAPAVLDDAGLTTFEMRRLAGLSSRRGGPDWRAVQQRFDDRFDASLYLLAVLGDDLFATSADLWLWSPAPWPAAPGVRTVPVQSDDGTLDRLAAAFDGPIVPSRPFLGARFIEADGLLVSGVLAGAGAAAAGLAPGDRVSSVDGAVVATVAELMDVASRSAGELVLGVETPNGPSEVRLPVDNRPGVYTLSDTSIVDQVLAARLSLELLRGESGLPRWLLQLNQAALYLRALEYQAAVPLLRTIEAPEGAGLGRAMVDYWLGTTLMSVDVAQYSDAARQSLTRALEQEGARLYHEGGPLLAPRARSRLAEIERVISN